MHFGKPVARRRSSRNGTSPFAGKKKALEMFILLRAQLAQLAQPANLKKRSTLFEMDCSLSHQPAERNIDYGKNRDSD
jgi:hypothetical protein